MGGLPVRVLVGAYVFGWLMWSVPLGNAQPSQSAPVQAALQCSIESDDPAVMRELAPKGVLFVFIDSDVWSISHTAQPDTSRFRVIGGISVHADRIVLSGGKSTDLNLSINRLSLEISVLSQAIVLAKGSCTMGNFVPLKKL